MKEEDKGTDAQSASSSPLRFSFLHTLLLHENFKDGQAL